MGICRWEWFDFRRLPFEDAFLNRRSSRSSSSRRKQEEKVAKIANFQKVSEVTLIRECLGALLMLFRPSLPWGFAAGSGSLLGDCLLKVPFWTEGVAGAGEQQQEEKQEEKVAKIIPFLKVSEVTLGSVWAQFSCFSVLHCHGDLPLGVVRF